MSQFGKLLTVGLMVLYYKLTCKNYNIINQITDSVGKLMHTSFYINVIQLSQNA